MFHVGRGDSPERAHDDAAHQTSALQPRFQSDADTLMAGGPIQVDSTEFLQSQTGAEASLDGAERAWQEGTAVADVEKANAPAPMPLVDDERLPGPAAPVAFVQPGDLTEPAKGEQGEAEGSSPEPDEALGEEVKKVNRTDSLRDLQPAKENLKAAVVSAILVFEPSLEQLAVRLRALVEENQEVKHVETLLQRWGQDQTTCTVQPGKACLAIVSRDLRPLDGPNPSALDISVKNCNYPLTAMLLRYVPLDLDAALVDVLNGHNPLTGQSLLYAAVRYSNRYTASVVDELLNRRVDINGPGRAPPEVEMMIVSCVRRAELPLLVQVLGHRADVNAKSADGKTLLQIAVERGNEEILAALLRSPGCEVNATNACGRTALVSALRTGRPPFPLVQQLLNARCDASKPDVAGVQPLFHTASIPEAGIHATLLASRANADAVASPSTDDRTRLLHVAAHAKNETLLTCLLEASAEPNARESFGRTVLHLAVSQKLSNATISAILDAHADPNLTAGQGAGGESPLRLAILAQSPAVDLLLKARADPNGRNLAGCTALQAAFCANSGSPDRSDSLKMCELLMSWRADPLSQRRTLLTSRESSYMSSLSRTVPTIPPLASMTVSLPISAQVTSVMQHPKYLPETWTQARFRRRRVKPGAAEQIEDFDPLFPLTLPPLDRRFNRTLDPRQKLPWRTT